MCLLCIEVAKGKMNIREISHALREMEMDDEHSELFVEIFSEKYKLEDLFAEVTKESTELFFNFLTEEEAAEIVGYLPYYMESED